MPLNLKTASVASATLLMALTACTKSSETTAQTDDGGPIRIGVAVSETGAYSVEGASVKQGYQFWESKVNDAAGIDVCGEQRPVEVIYYDDQSDPETAIKLTQRLISEDEVDFVFGPYSSGMTIATSAITEQYGTIMFAGGAAAESVFEQGNEYLFSPLSLTSQYTVSGLDLLADQGAQSVGILHSDEAPMVDIAEATEAYAEELGMEVTSVQSVPAAASDIKGALRQIRDGDPDVLVEAGTSVLGVLTTRTLRDLGWAPEVLMIQAPTEEAFVKQLGPEIAQGVMAPTQWEPVVDFSDDFFGAAEDYAADYRAEFGEDPSYLAASASAAAQSLQMALQEACTTETEAVREALVDMDAETFFGPINFAGPDDESGLMGANLERKMLTLQISEDGERVVVAPEEAANAEFTPMKPWSAR
ncbi:MAG TPA: amino acid ABC transporter substrate-binding protein [Thermomicrobiales bacterium]|nr:amino acid ABC transporter substrate-binding protein [Thermomicrobiales bacterium]